MTMQEYHKISIRLQNRKSAYFLNEQEEYVWNMMMIKKLFRVMVSPISTRIFNEKWKEALTNNIQICRPTAFSLAGYLHSLI